MVGANNECDTRGRLLVQDFSVDARNGCSRGHRADAQCASTLMFAALMMGHHFSISAL
jgi:hypothetical protein